MVIEKSHTAYLRGTAQAGFTRLANRLQKECEEALYIVPDQILEACKCLLAGTFPEDNEDEGGDRRYWLEGMYCTEHWEWRFSSSFDSQKNAYVFDYYFCRSEQYDRTYCGVKHVSGNSAVVRQRVWQQKGAIRYFCHHRPPCPGNIPAGYVTYETYPQGSERNKNGNIGEVTYNTPPSAEELWNSGLVLDNNWLEEWCRVGYGIFMPEQGSPCIEEAPSLLASLQKKQVFDGSMLCPRCAREPLRDQSCVSSEQAVGICKPCAEQEAKLAQTQTSIPLEAWSYLQWRVRHDEETALSILSNKD